GRRVDAEALTCGRGAVREDVAEAAAAICADHLGTDHPETDIGLLVDRILVRGRVERGPAAAGVVLRLRAEELRPATGAAVGARLEGLVVFARERRFRALLAQDPILLGRQLCTPLLICFLKFWHLHHSLAKA